MVTKVPVAIILFLAAVIVFHHAEVAAKKKQPHPESICDAETAFKFMRKPKTRGDQILFQGIPPDADVDVDSFATNEHACLDLFIINKDGMGFKNLTNTPALCEEGWWTKDGRILYRRIDFYARGSNPTMMSLSSGRESERYYIMDSDGSNKRMIEPEIYSAMMTEIR